MKRIATTKILVTVIFLCVAVMCVYVSNYVASYYEKLGREVPRWIYYATFAALGVAYMKFIETFSNGKDGKK